MKNVILSISILMGIGVFAQKESNREVSEILVKIAPMQMMAGEINLAAEFAINPYSSLEIEVGPTFSQIGFGAVNTHYSGDIIYDYPPYGPVYDARSAVGGHVSIGYRFYPLQFANAPRGLYISPIFKYRRYNTTYEDLYYGLENTTGYRDQLMFRFNSGYQFFLTDKFSLDVFWGFGIGMTSETVYNIASYYDSPSDTYINYWQKSSGRGARLNGTIGFKFGIGLN